MDIPRPKDLRRLWFRRGLYGLVLVGMVGGTSIALARVKPAAPSVDASTIWPDTVRRGEFVREVRGLGTLVPEDTRWIAASTAGRIERVLAQPGRAVTPDTVLLELSNPQLEQEVEEATLKARAAEAALENVRVQLRTDTIQQESVLAGIVSERQKAVMQADMNDALAQRQLVSELVRRQSRLDADQWNTRERLAREQLAAREQASRAQIAVQQSSLDQARAPAGLKQRQRGELRVRAGMTGVLQSIPVDVGQQVAPGTNLARVADPSRLKAVVKVPETQAKDIVTGQPVTVDTHNGVISGHVARIDPAVDAGTRTVDVALSGELPAGAVPDLSVDGVIELERVSHVLYVGRPAFGEEGRTVSMFRIDPDGHDAFRVAVKLGRASVNSIEVVEGLAEGDRVILSDMSNWDGSDRVRLH